MSIVDVPAYEGTSVYARSLELLDSETRALENEKNMKYGMRLRGYSPGCQPAGVKRRYDSPTTRYYDIIEYDRQLTKEEIEHYSLDEIEE